MGFVWSILLDHPHKMLMIIIMALELLSLEADPITVLPAFLKAQQWYI